MSSKHQAKARQERQVALSDLELDGEFSPSHRQTYLTQYPVKIANIQPLTPAQKEVFAAYQEGKNLLLHGLAGTGKSFLGTFLGLTDVMDHQSIHDKLIVIRSAVPTRALGFLPGDLDSKTEVYELPIKAICAELTGNGDGYGTLKGKGYLQFMTTTHLRGLTLSNAVVLVDEAQNLNFHELDSTITRMGKNCRLILCGDSSQTDFVSKFEAEGIVKFAKIIARMPSFKMIEFGVEDIVRSGLVKEYLLAKNAAEMAELVGSAPPQQHVQ